MKFVGADLHKKSITFCVVEKVNDKLTVCQRERIECQQLDRLQRFFESLGTFQVVVEATIGYDWFAALAEKYAQRVVIAHAGKLRIIAESTKKTDKVDARVLADFLAYDMIPEAWHPTPRVREHRTLVRRRCKIQSRITSIKNTIRGILTRYNADRADLFTRLGRRAVKKLKLLETERFVLDDLWEELEEVENRRAKVETRLMEFSLNAPLKEREARAVLKTLPGAGTVTIEVILAELGDWQRFRCSDAVVAFAGLAPGVRESDRRRKDLKLTKEGSPLLRWCLIQLAHRVKRNSTRWSQEFERLSKRIGKKKATCAIARRLLLVIYAMLREGKAYRLPAAA